MELNINLDYKKNLEYIPRWKDNRDLPKDQQIVVLFKNLNAKQKDNLFKNVSLDLPKGKLKQLRKLQREDETAFAEDPEFREASERQNDKAMKKCITSIKNLKLNGEAIDTLDKLINSPFGGLYTEIKEIFQAFLNEDFLTITS